MTVVVLGIDALDPELVDPDVHPNLTLKSYDRIETINSSAGEPSTHELWPTIITGLRPEDHGLVLDDGVAWQHPFLRIASVIAEYAVPDSFQTKLGAWLLNNTSQDAFRVPATYYQHEGLSTVFDGVESSAIGIPNYVVDTDSEDREHTIRREMGSLFKRDPDTRTGHTTSDVTEFYERCMEMVMIRLARVRRALRSRRYELVFGYTSGLDLIGHVSHDRPTVQQRAYDETNEFVGELLGDIGPDDELVLVSDHGLQDGLHTEEAMIASTAPALLADVSSVTDVRAAIEHELVQSDHSPGLHWADETSDTTSSEQVAEQLEALGYM